MKIVTKIELSEEERDILDQAKEILVNFDYESSDKDIEILDNGYPYNDKATLSKTMSYLDYILDT